MVRRRVLVSSVALSAVIVLAGACGNGTDDAASSTTVSPADTEVSETADRLAGRYANYNVVAYESTEMKTLIISYGFTDLSVKNGELVSTDSFCFSEHRSDQPIETTFSDAATSAIVPRSTPVELTVEGDVVRIHRPATPTGIGIHLEDPDNDPLPDDPNDPRIADDDGDGNPGVTAHIKLSDEVEGDLFIARREIFAYDVQEQADGSLTGSVEDDSEQLIIGASNPIFISTAEWIQVADPSKSPIIMKPVDEDWDCGRLRAERDGLFPPTPVVDW